MASIVADICQCLLCMYQLCVVHFTVLWELLYPLLYFIHKLTWLSDLPKIPELVSKELGFKPNQFDSRIYAFCAYTLAYNLQRNEKATFE